MDRQQAIALCGMDEITSALIGLYCAKNPDGKQIAAWFRGIDFEALRPEVSCMAAAVATASNCSGVPTELTPRLRGIMKYVHTLNAGMTAGLFALGKHYEEAGLPAALFGGTAVHLAYPDPPRRHIWRMEICVSEDDFPRATALAERTGFTVEVTPYSATARNGKTQCVFIRKGMAHTQGATQLTTNGVTFLMPCGAELFVSLAEAVFQLLSDAKPGARLIPWIMDLHCLTAAISDWEAVAATAEKHGSTAQVRLVLELYHALAPSLLTEQILALLGHKDHTVRLAQLLLKSQELHPGSSKLKRLWIQSKIKSEGSLSGALILFLSALWQAGLRKLTPGS